MIDKKESQEATTTQELKIQVPPEVQRGVYANQMFATHTQEEFILDFILASQPAAVVNARVIISPTHAKRIVAALQENIHNYESNFGEIAQINPIIPSDTIRH
ncbi:MAG: DUF3467 domain-containing protein [Mariprofundaceae bacterium]|nr:DUF3467 domain-containing protein [Mariprofundaceae bacterium]